MSSHSLVPTAPLPSPPQQLDLIDLFALEGKPTWTRAFPLWDALPKFLFTEKEGKKMPSFNAADMHTVSLTLDGELFDLEIKPAQVTVVKRIDGEKTKTNFFAFPGVREEIVSRGLRYIAVQKGTAALGRNENGGIQISFTLAQLQQVLAKDGHSFSFAEIDEALLILAGTQISLRKDGQKRKGADANLSMNFLSFYGASDSVTDDNAKIRVVGLCPLETQAIYSGSHHLLNYSRLMKLQTPLARRLFEYLMIHYRGAQKFPKNDTTPLPKPFTLTLEDILAYGCIQPRAQLRKTIERIRRALGELKKEGRLCKVDENLIFEHGKGRPKIKSCCWNVWLSDEDVQNMITSHSEAASFSPSPFPITSKIDRRKRAKAAIE